MSKAFWILGGAVSVMFWLSSVSEGLGSRQVVVHFIGKDLAFLSWQGERYGGWQFFVFFNTKNCEGLYL